MRNESSGDTVAPRRRAQARRQRAGGAEPALQAHADADQLPGAHAGAGRQRAASCSTSRTALAVYVDHQKEIIQRRTEFRLRKAKEREHIVEGLVKALDMIDAIIALIRGAEDVETARTGLMAAPFEFTEIQANYILDMQLRRLTQLEGQKLPRRARGAAGHDRRAAVDPRQPDQARRGDQGRARPRCATSTPTSGAPSSPSTSATSTCSTSSTTKRSSSCCRSKGYIKTVAADAFRRQGRGGRGRARRQPARRGLRRAPAHHDRALVPVVLLEPRASRTGCARTRSR